MTFYAITKKKLNPKPKNYLAFSDHSRRFSVSTAWKHKKQAFLLDRPNTYCTVIVRTINKLWILAALRAHAFLGSLKRKIGNLPPSTISVYLPQKILEKIAAFRQKSYKVCFSRTEFTGALLY